MHIMAINGSPHKEKNSTYHILAPLLEGMRSAGATTELVHLGQLQIRILCCLPVLRPHQGRAR